MMPDAVIQIYAAPIDDVSDGVRALEVGVVSVDTEHDLLPPRDVLLGYNTAWSMTQFLNHMKGFESLMLIRNGWYEDTWEHRSEELLMATIAHHIGDGFVFRLQSVNQFRVDEAYRGERVDFSSSAVMSVGNARIQFSNFIEYCRAEFGAELLQNDPDHGGIIPTGMS